MYYEKEAISKQLYDWLLKNGYADGNLIAKWKKQGYEKVRSAIILSGVTLPTFHSYVVSVVSRPRRRTSTVLASVEYPRSSSKRTKRFNASVAAAEAARAVTSNCLDFARFIPASRVYECGVCARCLCGRLCIWLLYA